MFRPIAVLCGAMDIVLPAASGLMLVMGATPHQAAWMILAVVGMSMGCMVSAYGLALGIPLD